MRKFNSLKSCTNCSMRKFNSLFGRLKIPTQMSISRLTLVFLAPFSDSLPFMPLRILTVHSRSHLLFEHRVDRNENLNQTYTCMPCERKMQQTRRPNPTATVNMSNHVGFQHFLGEDCYSHQGQLLPAGC